MKTIGEQDGGLKPDLHCLSAALDAAGGSGDWEAALRLLDEMRASGIKPDEFVYRWVAPLVGVRLFSFTDGQERRP